MDSSSRKSKLILYLAIPLGTLILSLAGIFAIINLFSVRNVSRTVMIYMVGSNLESENGFATNDLAGLDEPTTLAKNGINVVMIAGGSKKWRNDYVDVNETSIYKLSPDGFTKVKSSPVQNMGSPEVLSDFINYVTDNYHTDDYDLIFWNHGGAIDGSEYDELQHNDNLSLQELETGLQGTIFGHGRKLESIAFATCLNGSLEMAHMLKNYSRYLIASEETSLSLRGTSDFTFLSSVTPHDDGDTFGRKFVENYQAKISELRTRYANYSQDYNIYSTYSVVDLGRIDAVTTALDDFFSGINLGTNYNEIARVRANLYQYASSSTNNYDMVDLYNLATNLEPYSSTSSHALTAAIEDAVIYNFATNSESRGISIYFPFSGSNRAKDTFMSFYGSVSPAKSYTDFVSKFYNTQIAGVGTRELDFSANKMSVTSTSGQEADFSIELTPEQLTDFATARYLVFRNNPDFPGYYQPIFLGSEVTVDGNTLHANVRNHQLSVRDDEDGAYHIFYVAETSLESDHSNYEVAVVLEDYTGSIDTWRSAVANLMLTRDFATGKIGISGIRLISRSGDSDSDSAAMASGGFVGLTEYPSISFATSSYDIINPDLSFNYDYQATGTMQGWQEKTATLDLKLEDDFDDGYDYYCTFQIWDVYNNYTYTNFVKLK